MLENKMPIISDENSSLIQPDEHGTLWRFMSIPKYLSLISSRELIFTQIALLRHRDPKEGLFTNLQVLEAEHNDPMEELLHDLNSKITSPKGKKLTLNDLTPWDEYSAIRSSIDTYAQYVNCWNMTQHEPAQLWSVYASEQDGVAIKTSFSRLKKSLKDSGQIIQCGKINYLNYDEEKISLKDGFAPIFTKRIEFEHENEMRLCITDMTPTSEVNFSKKPAVIRQPCDIEVMIEEVRVAPFSEPWSKNAIDDVTRRFGLDFPIRRSCLV